MYKKWTIEEIQQVINEIAKQWDYPCMLPIEISKRAKTRLGAFFFKKNSNSIKGIKFVFSQRLLNGDFPEEIVKEVIIHEYLHYYCDTNLGVSNGHNSIFKRACIKSNISPNATLKFKANNIKSNYDNNKQYNIYCKKCGKLVCIHKRKDAVDRKLKYYISNCCKEKLIVR